MLDPVPGISLCPACLESQRDRVGLHQDRSHESRRRALLECDNATRHITPAAGNLTLLYRRGPGPTHTLRRYLEAYRRFRSLPIGTSLAQECVSPCDSFFEFRFGEHEIFALRPLHDFGCPDHPTRVEICDYCGVSARRRPPPPWYVSAMVSKRRAGLNGGSAAKHRRGRSSGVPRAKMSASKNGISKDPSTRTRTSLVGMTIYQPDLQPSALGRKLLDALER